MGKVLDRRPGENNGPEDKAAQKTELCAEFPEWNIIYTRDTGRWWATRGPLPRGDVTGVSDVDADTAGDLAAKLRAVPRAR